MINLTEQSIPQMPSQKKLTPKGNPNRIHVTLPDGVADDLHEWAASEHNKPATLAAFVVEQSVREAKEKGLIVGLVDLSGCKSLAHLIHRYWAKLIEYGRMDRLHDLKDGVKPTELEIARIALCLGVTEQEIEEVVQRGKSEVKNGA